MKLRWEVLLARLNLLSLRETVLLFLSIIAMCTLLVYTFLVSPAQVVNKELQQLFAKQNAELQRTRTEFKSVATPVDTQKILRDEIAAVKISLDAVNRTISGVATEAPLPLAQVLVHLLRQHERLTLLRTSTVTPEMAIGKATQAVSALPVGLTRQGVELTVSGPYSELTRYIETLENELPHVRWGTMKLISENPPTELTLQLFVVGEYPR
jgi:MSHA biogenesis protein MshJ